MSVDRLDTTDGSSAAEGSFLAENHNVMINPLVEDNLLIDLRSPTSSQQSSTTNLVPNEQR